MNVTHFRFSFIAILLAGFAGTSRCQTELTYHITKGWNMLSVPLTLADTRRLSVFPTSSSRAFVYGGCSECNPPDTVPRNAGFFIRFDSAQTITITGIEQPVDTLPVNTGWNLVGSHRVSVAVSNIVSEPPGIVTTRFYSYAKGRYQTVYTVEPGYGYWVRASQPGKIILR